MWARPAGGKARTALPNHHILVWNPEEFSFNQSNFFFFSSQPHPRHMEVPKLGVKSELQPLAYATATAIATPDLSRISDLHHSLWQHQTLNPLSRARGQTRILMDTSWVLNWLSHNRNSLNLGLCITLKTSYPVPLILLLENHNQKGKKTKQISEQ